MSTTIQNDHQQKQQKQQKQKQDEPLQFKTKQSRIDLINKLQNYLTSKFAVSCGRDTNDNDYETLLDFWNDRGLLSLDCEEGEEEVGVGEGGVVGESVALDANIHGGGEGGEQSMSANTNAKTSSTTSHKNRNCNNTPPQQSSSTSSSSWYEASHNFWENQTNAPATIDGMLGGFSVLSERDLAASRTFLEHILQFRHLNLNLNVNGDNTNNTSRSCECGAGIGRITKGLLLPLGISSCDLVETSPRLIQCAKQYIDEHHVPKCNFLCCGLQDFYPAEDTYDIIWIQWVIGYLTDWDLVSFLWRMGRALREGGIIVMKDNTCNEMAFLADCNDSDITRSFKYLMAIVEQSGLRVLHCPNDRQLIHWQEDFPDDIWPVPMICLTRNYQLSD